MNQSHQGATTSNNSRLPYRRISHLLRKELIKLVVQQGFSVYRACRLLHINNSTAKAIIRKYRTEGTIFLRKSERKPQRELPIENARQSQEEQQPISPQQIVENDTLGIMVPKGPESLSMGWFMVNLPIYFIPYS